MSMKPRHWLSVRNGDVQMRSRQGDAYCGLSMLRRVHSVRLSRRPTPLPVTSGSEGRVHRTAALAQCDDTLAVAQISPSFGTTSLVSGHAWTDQS